MSAPAPQPRTAPQTSTGQQTSTGPQPTTAQLPTTVSEKVLGKAWVLATALVTTLAARTLVSVGWRVVTGARPPKKDDPEVPKAQARAWGLATAVGLAATRLLVRRTGLGTPGR
ncbi:DUF4235 domain-containing protein [Microlunatus capsulatus]|uniref:DUF4235 domain-containing protein n=1 Tax=Microlunatus capsulatus TaxID=99117 RepID=A0ABS4ZFE8_9ACTN|nr:DUF4235 domain-containing protein [Microlunatus capsulatus]MBP2418963.1 hypothetical protein [Microlunatus capsulatus]